ncbi:multidrug effflux MFS transporter [Granulosicoccaceae sp. 1_MG-2023]|nr:multidrug effflux MFS transporter [Granulosicoccaceae sp. 1_MG-2023]
MTQSKIPFAPIAILVLALLSAVAPLSTDMYLAAFPLIASDLGTDASGVQMTLTSFLFGLALGQLLFGPLSDRTGRRRPLLAGTALAAVACILSVFAPDIHTLIVLRFLQGLGGAAGVVLARAIIADRTENATAAAKLFQIMMMIGGLAPVLAPMAGTGVVSLSGDWRTVFVVLSLLSLLSLTGVYRYIGESLPAEQRAADGVRAQMAAFGNVISNRRYLGYILTIGMTFVVLFGYISASPFVIQGVLGLSPQAFALVFGTNAAGIIIVSASTAKLLDRFKPRQLAAAGLSVLLCGSLLVLLAVLNGASAMFLLPALFITVSSVGLVMGNSSALALAQTPHARGTASALMGATQFSLGAVASPLVGLAGKHSALPMAVVMVTAAILAITAFSTLARAAEAVPDAGALT